MGKTLVGGAMRISFPEEQALPGPWWLGTGKEVLATCLDGKTSALLGALWGASVRVV